MKKICAMESHLRSKMISTEMIVATNNGLIDKKFAYCPRTLDHTSVLESMSVYQIFRNRQCWNDLRVRFYDFGYFDNLALSLQCNILNRCHVSPENTGCIKMQINKSAQRVGW